VTRARGSKPRDVAASVKARLLAHARAHAEDFNALLIRYVLERLLYRLSMSRHASEFVLKGALLFVIWSARPHRATKDLDLLGSGTPDTQRLAAVFRELCQAPGDDGVTFEAGRVRAAPIREDAVYDGIRLTFVARLGNARVPVQVDVGFGDTTVPEPQMTELPTILSFPAPKLRVYARESAIAEKLHAMVERGFGNTRMKDYYDLWFLSSAYAFDGAILAAAVRATFERRQTAIPSSEPMGLSDEFATDEVKLGQWKAFLRRARLTNDPPPFEHLVAGLRLFLLPVLAAAASTEGFTRSWTVNGSWQALE
jgi:predicted nucleotidyltransferase component of viral defense system